MFDVMFWPIAACILLPWLLVYLGLHVVQRGIIFIDIAMAQMASLGICIAVLLNFEPESFISYAIGLALTLVGAALFATTGKRESEIPQEAIIGIAYVVAAAAAVLLLSKSPHGNEEIRNMLVGDITVVSAVEVWKCFAVFVAVGVLHFLLRRNFMLVSFDRASAYERGLKVRLWDFLFYATFGVVVTVFVRVAGVLLVFSYLIVPAVCAVTLARSTPLRLLLGWIISLLGGIIGLFWSFYGDFPSGAAIVCTFGVLLFVISIASVALRSRAR
ncbi:MAG: metal ABC transporter permease [Verrucomicrobia bacterium]|nr:metal ABC transporter permease [Verrucomicrobiota bacterium]